MLSVVIGSGASRCAAISSALGDLRSQHFNDKYQVGPKIQGVPMWDTVVWQSPRAGTRIATGATVSLSAEQQQNLQAKTRL